MFIGDMTTAQPIKVKTGDVIVMTLTANGIDPFFIPNLTQQLKVDDSGSTYAFVDIKSKGSSFNTAIVRLVAEGNGTTTTDAIKYLLAEANAVKNITLFNLDITHIEVMSMGQAKQQDIEEEKQKTSPPESDIANQSIWNKVFGTNQPKQSWGEYLFGISGTQIILVVGGLGLFLIWTKLPSFKRKSRQ